MRSKKILILVADDYEDIELEYPKLRLREEGAEVVIAGEKAKQKYAGKKGHFCEAEVSFDSINVNEFHALVIPGGYAPDRLRKIPRVLEIIREFHESKKLIAYICHAGWLLISAQIIKSVKCTSYISIKDDMINAGAKWVDESVVVDQNIISSRFPDDLPNFCREIIRTLTNL